MSSMNSLLSSLGIGGGSGSAAQRYGKSGNTGSTGTSAHSGSGYGNSTTGGSGYSATNPPPGFTAAQWSQLLTLAKSNTQLAALIKQYTSASAKPDPAWRREMPKDTSQLLRQLSFNAGEIGMPGGYVGAVQLPAYGSTQAPVNNPDMSKYGQGQGIGEATFYQQSMKGGMAPIAAMSPLGVPDGWNPGGSSTSSLQQQLQAYLSGLASSGGGSSRYSGVSFDNFFKNWLKGTGEALKNNPGAGPFNFFKQLDNWRAANPSSNPPAGGGNSNASGSTSGATNTPPSSQIPGATNGVPIPLPFGF